MWGGGGAGDNKIPACWVGGGRGYIRGIRDLQLFGAGKTPYGAANPSMYLCIYIYIYMYIYLPVCQNP